ARSLTMTTVTPAPPAPAPPAWTSPDSTLPALCGPRRDPGIRTRTRDQQQSRRPNPVLEQQGFARTSRRVGGKRRGDDGAGRAPSRATPRPTDARVWESIDPRGPSTALAGETGSSPQPGRLCSPPWPSGRRPAIPRLRTLSGAPPDPRIEGWGLQESHPP